MLIRDKKRCWQFCMWVRCCCILHNLLLKRGDDTYDAIEEGDSADVVGSSSYRAHFSIEGGKDKRERIKQEVLSTRYPGVYSQIS